MLNFTIYLYCLMYNSQLITSDLKEETKIDIIVHDFINSNIEED